MGKTINELLEEQKGHTPIVDIMGNPTRKIFDDYVESDFKDYTFWDFIKDIFRF